MINPSQARHYALSELKTTKTDALDKEIATVLKTDPAWATSVALVQTITGVGPITAYWLVVVTLNFTSCQSDRQSDALTTDLSP